MSAGFEVHRAFVLENRSLFGVAGVITDGMVHVGMEVGIEGDEDTFAAHVHAVEFVDPDAGGGGAPEPTLLFSYSNPDKLQRWRQMEWEGKKLELHW